jgi:uncharacterized membrane protein
LGGTLPFLAGTGKRDDEAACPAGSVTLSAAGSACWFTAFAMAIVALVRTIGRVEISITLLFSRFYLKETLRPGDAAELALVVCGVPLVVSGS